MPDKLATFVEAHALLPWAWGRVDCTLTLADWVVANGRPDPAVKWRGAYDEAGWREAIAARGGILPIVAGICDELGIRETAAQDRGDVGVIGSSFRFERQWGAIFDGRRWLVRGPQGFVAMTAKPLRVWQVN